MRTTRVEIIRLWTEPKQEEERVRKINYWRTQAYEKWMTWYRTVRPYEDTGGLDELDALSGK